MKSAPLALPVRNDVSAIRLPESLPGTANGWAIYAPARGDSYGELVCVWPDRKSAEGFVNRFNQTRIPGDLLAFVEAVEVHNLPKCSTYRAHRLAKGGAA